MWSWPDNKVKWEEHSSGIPRALTALALSLSKVDLSAHREHTGVSGLRWIAMYLPSRLGISGQEGDQPTVSAGSVKVWHTTLQLREPHFRSSPSQKYLLMPSHSLFPTYNVFHSQVSMYLVIYSFFQINLESYFLESSSHQPGRGN
jgi:hypothetical protein